jgi:catalase
VRSRPEHRTVGECVWEPSNHRLYNHNSYKSFNLDFAKNFIAMPVPQSSPVFETISSNVLTTAFGTPVTSTTVAISVQNEASQPGPQLLEDFSHISKLQHLNRERIPERVVHARGTVAMGEFTSTKSLSDVTSLDLFQQEGVTCPVLVRFSQVAGSKGSADSVRDVRGFSTRFYTDHGLWDVVGNNIPVFFVQSSIQFPDLVHALKPEPKLEVPQASAAHTNAWDFISRTEEAAHMSMWFLSDFAVPHSYRTMKGFGVHSFIFTVSQGNTIKETFVRFTWLPRAGVHSNLFDEAQKMGGKAPDSLRMDLAEAIKNGVFPTFDLAVQLVPMNDVNKYGFSMLDSTKYLSPMDVSYQIVGTMVLNKLPEEFFSQTEQVGFAPSHLVPGIAASNDPLLQGRLFAYEDTQLYRLGPNHHLLPPQISKSPIFNHFRDGLMQTQVNPNNVNYHARDHTGCPAMGVISGHANIPSTQPIQGRKAAEQFLAQGFEDHFTHARIFWQSQSEMEKQHLISAAWFELSHCTSEVRHRMIHNIFNHIDYGLACEVARGLGMSNSPASEKIGKLRTDASLSMAGNPATDEELKGRKVAFLVSRNSNVEAIHAVKEKMLEKGVSVKLIGTTLQDIGELSPDAMFLASTSTLFDAIYVPGGGHQLKTDDLAMKFIEEAFKHCKPIACSPPVTFPVLACKGLWASLKKLPELLQVPCLLTLLKPKKD